MLVGVAKGCNSVGDASSNHGELINEVINELVAAVRQKEGISFPSGTKE
jgi:hypothetical protein